MRVAHLKPVYPTWVNVGMVCGGYEDNQFGKSLCIASSTARASARRSLKTRFSNGNGKMSVSPCKATLRSAALIADSMFIFSFHAMAFGKGLADFAFAGFVGGPSEIRMTSSECRTGELFSLQGALHNSRFMPVMEAGVFCRNRRLACGL